MLQMSHMKWCQKIWAHMRAVTSGVSTGGTVALVLKLLNWADKQPLAVPPVFEPLPWQLDGPSFVLGVAVGLTAYVVQPGLVLWMVFLGGHYYPRFLRCWKVGRSDQMLPRGPYACS